MSVFAVEYVYAAESEATRDEYRPAHREFLAGLKPENGSVTLVASGPYTDGSGALLLMAAPDEATLGEALKQDPFNIHNTIAALRITGWIPATGELSHHA